MSQPVQWVDYAILEAMWNHLDDSIQALRTRTDKIEQRLSSLGKAGSFEIIEFANLPVGGDIQCAVAFVPNAAGPGGAGTGVYAYYRPDTQQWYNFYNNALVSL